MRTALVGATALILVWSCAGKVGGVTFVNGGFESGDFSGWTVGGVTNGHGVALDGTSISGVHSIFDPAFVNVRSGSYAAYAVVADERFEYLSLSQEVYLPAGTHVVGFFMGNDSGSGFKTNGAVNGKRLATFIDGVHHRFTTRPPYALGRIPPGSTANDMYEFSTEFTSAGGPTSFELRISGSGSWRPGISVDDAFLIPATFEEELHRPRPDQSSDNKHAGWRAA